MTSPRPVRVAAVAGAITGVLDAVLTLAGNPDPADASYRAGYALGAVLLALAWAWPVGLAVSWWSHRGPSTRARGGPVAAGAVVSVWAVTVLADAWRAGQPAPALAVLLAVLALGSLAAARLAIDGARALEAMPAVRRWVVEGGAVAILLATSMVVAPSGLREFEGGGGPCPDVARPVPLGPNVLLVTVDALRADVARDMRSYQRLAGAGIEFSEHVTTSPWTLPAVATLLTGLPWDEHGAGRSLSTHSLLAKASVPPDVPTVAGVLGGRGYRTHAIVTNPFLTARYGIDRGFCSFENVTMRGETVRALGATTVMRALRILSPRLLPSDGARVVRTRAEEWLDHARDRPFLLWLHFLDPHAPYGDRDGMPTSLVLDLTAFENSRGLEVPFRNVARTRAGEYRPDGAERSAIFSLYRADVALVDDEIERLLDFLDRRGLSDRTAIVLTADHGEEFWEHGGVEHGRTLYDEVLRIPLVIVPAGGLGRPERRASLTSILDLAPTLLGLTGTPAPGWRGTDLGHASPPDGRVVSLGNLLFGEEWVGARSVGFKYMRSDAGEERLYDLARDPMERVDEVARRADVVAAMRGGDFGLVAHRGHPTPALAAPPWPPLDRDAIAGALMMHLTPAETR